MSSADHILDRQEGTDVRSRIIAAAAALIATGGGEAATTRAVAAAAAVQAPTIYRLFGDKRGLLEAVARQTFADYVQSKVDRSSDPDPVKDLHDRWHAHIAFGLAHPALHAFISAASRDGFSPADAGLAVLRERVAAIARSGRLRVSEKRAVDLIHSMGSGVISTMLARGAADSSDLPQAALDAVFGTILDGRSDVADRSTSAMATGLKARLAEFVGLSDGERLLLAELLDRIARSDPERPRAKSQRRSVRERSPDA